MLPLEYTTLSPYGVCLSYVISGPMDDPVYTATFDIRGEEKTYKLDEAIPDTDGTPGPDWIDQYVYLSINAGTNTVTVASSSVIDLSLADTCEVLAVDAANGTMTLKATLGVVFVDNEDTVIYKLDSAGNKVYVGFAGIKAGDLLKWTEYVFEVVTP